MLSKKLRSEIKNFLSRYTHHKTAADDLNKLVSEAFTEGFLEGEKSYQFKVVQQAETASTAVTIPYGVMTEEVIELPDFSRRDDQDETDE